MVWRQATFLYFQFHYLFRHLSVWQTLLQPVIGKAWSENPIQTSLFPRVGEPMTATIFTFSLVSDLVNIDSIRLALKEKWYQLDNWEATFWPKYTGWNTFRTGQETEDQFFVFDSTDWRAQKIWKKRQQTRMHSNLTIGKTVESKTINQLISKWFFFITFLASFGFLWLEGRLR